MPRETFARQRARALYADEIERKGAAWRNTAGNVRAGFENLWIAPALDLIERLVQQAGDGDDPEEDDRT